jgi:hypothetical protein
MGGWALSAAHVRSYWEIHLIVAALSWATFVAAVIWVSYLAVEPYMRRYWPDTLISWTRLYSGRVQDPLVASHMLAGILAFAAVNALTGAFLYIAGGQRVGSLVNIPALSSGRMFVATVLTSIALNSFVIVALFVLVVVARLLVRRVWIADLLVSILVGLALEVFQSTIPACTRHWRSSTSPARTSCYGCSAGMAWWLPSHSLPCSECSA